MGEAKRRLPIVRTNDEGGAEERPAWHWAAIGVVAIFLAWLPLAMIVGAVSATVSMGEPSTRVQALVATASASTYALASFGAGYLVGRFGGNAGKREATMAGAIAGFVAGIVAALGGGGALVVVLAAAVLAPLGAGSARLGASRGVTKR